MRLSPVIFPRCASANSNVPSCTSNSATSAAPPTRSVPRPIPFAGRIRLAGCAVTLSSTPSKDIPKFRNFDIVVGRSNTGPSTLAAYRSVLIVSGGWPWSSIARATSKLKLPDPCPMSMMTPRARASTTSGRTLPSGPMGRFAWPVKLCVRISPSRSRFNTSFRSGGANPTCTMIRTFSSSQISRANSRSGMACSRTILNAANTLMPRSRSRFSSTVRIVARFWLRGKTVGSTPGRMLGVTCRNPYTRPCAGSMIKRRNPLKLPACDVPASTIVHTPLRAHTGSGSMPREDPPQYTCVCRSIRPGVTRRPDASITWPASSVGRSGPMAAIFSPSIATSRSPDRSPPGSSTRPPLISISYPILFS